MPKSNNDLLIRIDERQKEMASDILAIKGKLDCKVDNDRAYEARGKKIETLWDDRNKMIGWMLGAGVAGGGIATLISGMVKTVFALF